MTNPTHSSSRSLIAIILPNLEGGGAERVHLELAREFLALGYGVEFVLLRKEGPLLAAMPEGASVVGLDVTNFRYALGPLRRYFHERGPSLTIASMWPLSAVAIVAARTVRHRPRILIGEHVDFVSGGRESRFSTMVMKRFGRFLYGAADAVLCVSAGARTALAQITGLPERRIAVVYNPVRSPERIAALPVTELTDWWRGSEHRLLSAGRLTKQKDHVTLLRAMALLPRSIDARLVILGEGPERSALETMIDALDLKSRVRLAGFSRDVPSFLASASLFVLSSRWEGLGNVIIEALLQGVPVVSTDCPSGPAEILEGGRYGRLVPMQDPGALAASIMTELDEVREPGCLVERGMTFAPRQAAENYLRLLDPAFSSLGTLTTP